MIFSKKKKDGTTESAWSNKVLSISKLSMCKGRELLLSGRNHLSLINGEMFSAIALVFPLIICNLLSGVVENDIAIVAIYALVVFLTATPVLFGVVKIAGGAYRGEAIDLRELFYAYASFLKYIKLIFLGLVNLLRLITPISIGLIFAVVLDKVLASTSISPRLVGLICIALWIFVTFVCTLFTQRLYAVSYLVICEDLGTIEAIKYSWRITRGYTWQILKLRVKLLPLTIGSIIVVCMPLFAYTIPYRVCVYIVMCNKLMAGEQTDALEYLSHLSEEISNVISPEEISEGEEEINEQDN